MPLSKKKRNSELAGWERPAPAALDKCFSEYSVTSLISGNHGNAVYRGIQNSLERAVAIRVLAPAGSDDAAFAQRYREAVRTTSTLKHPGIITIHDFGSIDIPCCGHCFYVVMEFVHGESVGELIESGGLNPNVALNLVTQICHAIEYANEQGCAQGNMGPENVFVTKSGSVKLDYFELARSAAFKESHRNTAPEILDGDEASHLSDIYSLGAMIFEMLTGSSPTEAGRLQAPRIDTGLNSAIRKAMEEDPDNRYQHISEIRTEIDTIAGRLQYRRRKRKRLAVAAIALVVAVGGAFAFYRPEPKLFRPPPRVVEADIRVTTTLDGKAVPGSLREAIAKAKSGDVIGFDPSLSGQTILLNSNDGLLLGKSITIDAGDLGELLTVDANGAKRVFRMYSKNFEITLVNLRITGGNSELEGGGIRNLGADLTLVNCAIVNNSSTSLRGGGLYNTERGSITMESCLIAGNVSVESGAGICNFGGKTMILKNCLITGNECTKKSRHGCAVLNVNYSTMELIHCTVVGNREAGVRSHHLSNLFIENSIISNNEGYSYDDIFIRKKEGGGLETRGVNIVNDLNADMKSGDPPIIRDHMLGPLADYGGWTPTMRPLPGSPAIDAAVETDLKSDIRGLDRPIDGDGDGIALPDLGAVELDPEGVDR